MTVVYEIFTIRMIENFVIKLEVLSPCMSNFEIFLDVYRIPVKRTENSFCFKMK